MSDLSDKFYNKMELLSIAKEKQIPEQYFEDFVAFIEKDIKQMTDDGEIDEKEIGTAAINFAVEYFDKYQLEIQKGHSKEWSHLYAESIEEHPHAFNDAFNAIKANSSEKANEELKIHCKAMGGDELYTKHFIFLMENGGALSNPDKQAARYSAIYKEQIVLGKSIVFAHEYGDLMAMGEYSEVYCFVYAKYYEKTILQGNSEKLAGSVADKIAEYYANQYRNSNQLEYNEFDLLKESEIKKTFKDLA